MIWQNLFFAGIILSWTSLVCTDVVLNPTRNLFVYLNVTENGISLTSVRDQDKRYVGELGIKNTQYRNYDIHTNNRTLAILDFFDRELKVSVIVNDDNWQLNIKWITTNKGKLTDCMSLGDLYWYGGPEQKHQKWPVEKSIFKDYSYVTKEQSNNAITEPYWINSQGTIFYVDKSVPLFIDQNNIKPGHLCLIADIKPPYSNSRQTTDLIYDIVFTKNAKVGHQYAVERYLGKPVAVPDSRMIQYPIWSTWAQYGSNIDHAKVFNLMVKIAEYGFPNSQLEIDDNWEDCYGSLSVNENFKNLKNLSDSLSLFEYRVTLWIHPFINYNCDIFKEAKEKGYLVKDEAGNVLTKWWNSKQSSAGYIDFTNPKATSWWTKRLIDLQNKYNISSFKFDAGESSWSPQIPVQTGNIRENPSHITSAFLRAVADFGPMIEVRTGQRTQDLPVFVRMLDKDSQWSFENGLPTLVTTLLQMNMNGYTFVLPDMIGGNGYNDEKPEKELFIRWLQANTFMPSMQFSILPWAFDNQTVNLSRKYSELHTKYSKEIMNAMTRSVKYGEPVNAPIWWIDPQDSIALSIGDEFLLGSNILVAPVLKKGATSRDIYLPAGRWQYREDGEIYEGKQWLKDFPAPLDTLPYFIYHNSSFGLRSCFITIIFTFIISTFINRQLCALI